MIAKTPALRKILLCFFILLPAGTGYLCNTLSVHAFKPALFTAPSFGGFFISRGFTAILGGRK
ncbi:MAG: hypothetical protein LBC31_06150 [Treponema sp.]|nr:hypothetical protein [Treponema sp.]